MGCEGSLRHNFTAHERSIKPNLLFLGPLICSLLPEGLLSEFIFHFTEQYQINSSYK